MTDILTQHGSTLHYLCSWYDFPTMNFRRAPDILLKFQESGVWNALFPSMINNQIDACFVHACATCATSGYPGMGRAFLTPVMPAAYEYGLNYPPHLYTAWRPTVMESTGQLEQSPSYVMKHHYN